MECPALMEFRNGLNMTYIMDGVEFFMKLLAERARLEREGVTLTASTLNDEGAHKYNSHIYRFDAFDR
jgi:hypothetical protein